MEREVEGAESFKTLFTEPAPQIYDLRPLREGLCLPLIGVENQFAKDVAHRYRSETPEAFETFKKVWLQHTINELQRELHTLYPVQNIH